MEKSNSYFIRSQRFWLGILAAGFGVLAIPIIYFIQMQNKGETSLAVSMALAETKRRGSARAEVVGLRLEDHVWIVHLQRYPATVGGHATVRVSEGGAIIDFQPGL